MEQLLKLFTPENYQLDLKISRSHQKLSGTILISGRPHGGTVKFHAKNLTIFGVKNQSFTYDGNIITISDQTPGAVTQYEISFETPLVNNLEGCYLSTYQHNGRTETLVTTQFESHYARQAFPCIDEPAAKATFDLQITVDDLDPRDVVLANTPLVAQDQNTFTFATTPRMSTYLLAWVIGKLHKVETTNQHGVKVASYAALNQPLDALTFANDTAAGALDYYDEKFGLKYPLEKLDQVALPDFEAGAMENWGLVTYRESCLLAPSTATLDDKKSIALTITHELSHQWFGDLVTMAWWDDLWLNESFASVMEYYATDALYPDFNTWEDFFTGDCFAALRRDCTPGVQSVRQPVHDPAEIATLFDGAIVYAKGARLILMLIRLMTPAKFDQGIKDYFAKFAYQNTIGDDLWACLQPYADFDVKRFMYAWISQPGYPALKVSTLSASSVNASAQASDAPAPLTLKSQSRFLIDNSTDGTEWPLPAVTDDLSGHYLLDLTDQQFQAKLDHFTDLSLEQKLRLLLDRLLLAKTDRVASASLLDLLPKFQAETSAPIWDLLATIMGDLQLFCPPESEGHRNYQKYLQNIFNKRMDNIDLGVLTDNDSINTRNVLLGVAYYSEYQPTLERLADLYNQAQAATTATAPDFSVLDPELRSGILLAKFYFAETELFPVLFDAYRSTADPSLKSELLAILAEKSRQSSHLDQALALLSRRDLVRSQDHIFLYVHLLRNHRTRERALDWITKNWPYVTEIAGEKSLEDYLRLSAGAARTPEQAQTFTDFFGQFATDPALQRAYQMAEIDISARLHLIATDTPPVTEKLAELVK